MCADDLVIHRVFAQGDCYRRHFQFNAVALHRDSIAIGGETEIAHLYRFVTMIDDENLGIIGNHGI